jgi:hypothetical protein
MPYNVAFDVAHKPRGKIDENLTELRDFLNANEFTCYNFLETPITQASLKPYDVLVFVCPDFAKISSLEISEILNWVTEDGGGLLLLSHAGGDRGRNSNLSELSQNFGISFENDQVLDTTYNLGMENMPIITSFIPPHPITNGLNSLCYRSGCSLAILGNAISIASSNESSEPFSCPLLCVSEPSHGRVCAIGSYEMFRDKLGGGFGFDEHPNLAFNIFSWLISDYRMELRSKGSIPDLQAKPIEPIGMNAEGNVPLARNIGLDVSMKISNKSDLLRLLKTFQEQINVMRTAIDTLIKTTEATEGEILEIKKEQLSHKTYSLDQGGEIQAKVLSSQDDFLNFELDPKLTELPPKPPSLSEQEPPKMKDSFQFKPSPKMKKKDKPDKQELLEEKDGLENKINSVRNLLEFMEKKNKSGEIDAKSYQKRVTQLKNDIKKAQNRIDEINTRIK